MTWFGGRSYLRGDIGCDFAGERCVGGGRVVLPEDRASCDEQVGARFAHGRDVLCVDAAVDLDMNRLGQGPAQLGDSTKRLGHELLAGEARMDAHAQREIGAFRGAGGHGDLGLGVEGDTGAQAELTGTRDRRRRVRDRLDVEGHAVTARGLDALELALGRLDHQVAVEPAATFVDGPGDRLEHDGADRDLADEMPVAEVEVENPAARVEQLLELCAEAREFCSVDGGLDLGPSYPVGPAHGRTVPGTWATSSTRRSSRRRPRPTLSSTGCAWASARARPLPSCSTRSPPGTSPSAVWPRACRPRSTLGRSASPSSRSTPSTGSTSRSTAPTRSRRRAG